MDSSRELRRLEQVAHEDAELREWAIARLGAPARAGEEEHVYALARLCDAADTEVSALAPWDAGARLQLRKQLAGAYRDLPRAAYRERLLGLVTHPSVAMRRLAMWGLSERAWLRDPQVYAAVLGRLEDDPSDDVRLAAAMGLQQRHLAEPRVRDALLALARRAAPRGIRTSALVSLQPLARRGDPVTLAALAELSRAPDPDTRADTLRCLAAGLRYLPARAAICARLADPQEEPSLRLESAGLLSTLARSGDADALASILAAYTGTPALPHNEAWTALVADLARARQARRALRALAAQDGAVAALLSGHKET